MGDPFLVHPDHAPTPYTADQIRQGCPPGRTVTTRTETPDDPADLSTTVFLETDEVGAIIEAGGVRHRVSWADLQAHASFPAERTTITEDVVETPLGEMECICYRVVADGSVTSFWFAKKRPGMPVRSVTESGGSVVSTSVVVADDVVS